MSAQSAVAPPPGTRLVGAVGVGAGRSLQSAQSRSAGHVIAQFAHPVLALPDGSSMRTSCNWCLLPQVDHHATTTTLRSCAGCSAAVYCRRACQRLHWREAHKYECEALGRVRARAGKDWLPTPVRAAVQLLLREQAGDAAVRAAFGPHGLLSANRDAFRLCTSVWSDMGLQAVAALSYGALSTTAEMLERARDVLCKLQTNAFHRQDADTGASSVFVDPALAMVNHSCVPNAFVGFEGRTATLRALRQLHDGEEITISYIDYTLPRSRRRIALQLYHFQCMCSRCKHDKNVYDVCRDLALPSPLTFTLAPTPCPEPSQLEMETLYETWLAADSLKQRWEICEPLVRSGLCAIEPVPTTVLAMATEAIRSASYVQGLVLYCFLSVRCDPVRYAISAPSRAEALFAVAKLMSEIGPSLTSANGAEICPHPGIWACLRSCDPASICETLLGLVLRWGCQGAPESIVAGARAMLQDLEALPGRAHESHLVRAWAADPCHGEGAAFVRLTVLGPMERLSDFAADLIRTVVDEQGGCSTEGVSRRRN